MKVLEQLWQPTERSECSTFNLELEGDTLKIVLKFDELGNSQLQGKLSLLLMERQTRDSLKFPVMGDNEDGNTSLLNFEILLNEHINAFTEGVWDAYLLIESAGKDRKVRVKNKLSESVEIPYYFIKSKNKSFIPYTTIKGNLSFKCEDSKAVLKIENIVLEENGVLKLSGYFLVPSWNVKKATDVKKTLIFGNGNNEIAVPLNNVSRKDITSLYGQSGINYDWAGFSIQLDFQNKTYGLMNGKSTQLFIRVEHEQLSMIMPIVISPTIIFNKYASFQTSEGIKKISLNIDNESDTLAVQVSTDDLQAEVDTIYSDNGEIIINGRIITTNGDSWSEPNEVYLVVKNRDSDEEFEFQIDINQMIFSYTFDIKTQLEKGVFTEGIWDLYLRIKNNLYRLVTRLDGVLNKQKLVSIPQQMITDPSNEIIVVKPYYTLHEEVSILTRDYVVTKSIDKVEIDNGVFIIEGKINVQPPNDDFPSKLNGQITMKGQYGEKYQLPVTWEVTKTGRTKLEFQFTAKADLKNLGLQMKADLILRDIDFDLIQSEMYFDNGKILFSMNIDPGKVVLTLEDRIKQNPKYKVKLAKWGERLYRLCNKLLPINKNTIIFQSFHGKSYTDSPKAIYEEMLAQNYDMKAVWILNNLKEELPGSPVLVRPHSLKYYYYMAIGKYFVNNGNFPDFYEKREDTIHLQTWHGTPLKKLGFDIDPNSPSYAENTSPALLRRNARWDYLIGPNEYTSKILKRAFKFNNTMLDVGYPRNDIFYKGNLDEKGKLVKEKLGIPENKKVILYAPTWRDYDFHNGNHNNPYEFKFNLEKFKENFGEEYVLLLRLHYRDASRIRLQEFEDFVYNASSYDDIQELYLISDILITDYSSVMFDYANLNRPIIFFTYDLSRYGSQVRGFYFDFQKEAPGPIVLREEQLFHSIKNIESIQHLFKTRYENFKNKFCHWEDGNASKRTVEAVFKGMKRKGEQV